MLTREKAACQDSPDMLKVEREGDIYFIVPEGELLAGQGDDRLRDELDRLHSQGSTKVVIDFSKVPYIDSSILGQMVHGYSMFKKAGGDLKLLNPSKRIIDVLSLTRLITVFEVYKNRQQILESWGS